MINYVYIFIILNINIYNLFFFYKKSENDISITTRYTVAPSVAFPLSQDTQAALEKFKNNELSFIKLVYNNFLLSLSNND